MRFIGCNKFLKTRILETIEMASFLEKSGGMICVAILGLLMVGCETRDYEPLILNQKLKELQDEVDALKAEVETLKTSGAVPSSGDRVSQNSPVPSVSAPQTPAVPDVPSISVEEEAAIRAELENLDVYFVLDGSGYAQEADLMESRSPNDILAKLAEFPNLTRVLLDGTKADLDTFDALSKITGLAHLEIERSSPTAASFEKLKGLKGLKFLQLHKATLSADGMRVLAQFPALEQIRCGQTRVGDEELSYLSSLKTLKAIDLSDCNRVTIAGIQSLAKCPKLAFLKVWGKSIDNECMKHVAQMKSMRVLGLNDTRVDDEGIKLLAGLNLKEVHLFRTAVGDEGLRVLSQMPNMETLNLRDTRLSDQGVEYLANLKKLKKLDLSECNSPGITDQAGASFAKMENLRQLNLWATTISDPCVQQITSMRQLTWLNLDNTKITDQGVAMLSDMPQLTWLHLGKTAVTDQAVGVLLGLENLKYLDISHTKITEDGYYELDDFFAPKDCTIIAP